MIQYVHNVFQFATATKKNEKNSNNMKRLTGRWAYNREGSYPAGLEPGCFFCLQVDGPTTGGGGL